jgi:membrane dipeptidase
MICEELVWHEPGSCWEWPDRYLLIDTVSDVARARSSGQVGIVFDIEGGSALNGQLSMVELCRDVGVR